MPMQFDPVWTDYFPFRGGLILTLPALSTPPGSLFDVVNYEPDHNGGYRRGPAYERFDGRTSPSGAGYTAVACTLTSTPAAGTVLTIGAATCTFVKAVTGGMLVTLVTGTIPASTAITGTGAAGTTGNPVTLVYSPTTAEEATNNRDVATVVSALIGAVPGSGSVLGVVLYNGSVYAWRNNAGGTAAVMHKATTAGWTPVTLNEEVSFSNANTTVVEGATITQGAVSATIRRVLVETGTLASGTNTGRLVISGRTGGNFAAGATTGAVCTLAGAQTAQSFPAGGKYRFDQNNFTGSANGLRLYGANGVGRAFEFDGTYLAFINTTAATDTPSFVKCHRNYLYLSIGSNLFNSSAGNPYRFVTSEGAAQTGVGADITGLFMLPGLALGIATRQFTTSLVGASSSTWTLQLISPDTGAVADTVQNLGETYALDDQGVIKIMPTQNYGNFNYNTDSRLVQPLIDAARNLAVCSVINRSANLYRVFLSDKRVIVGLPGKPMAFTALTLAHQASCAYSGEDTNGVERTFFGADDGYVYEMDKGQSHAGTAIEAYVKLSYYNIKSPRLRKRFMRAVLEMSAQLYTQIKFIFELSYGDPNVNTSTLADVGVSVATSGRGGSWNVATWDQFFYDAQDIAAPQLDMTGTGTNVALVFYSNTDLDPGHTLQGATIHFKPRRNER